MKNMRKIKVCAFIKKDNKMLILKRSHADSHYPKMWDIPSGDINEKETIKKALVREVKEETNLDIEIKGLSSIWEEKEKDGILIGLVFECSVLKGNVKLSNEHEDFKWIPKEEIDNYEYVYGIKEALSKFNLFL